MIKQTHVRHQGYAATLLAGRRLCLCFLFMGWASDLRRLFDGRAGQGDGDGV